MDIEKKEKKTWKNGSERAQLFHALRRQDYTIKEAMQISGLKTTQAYNVEKKLLAGDGTLHNMARANIRKLAKGEKIGEIEEIRDSTVLAANNVILDRTEPKVNKIEQDTRSISIAVTADVTVWADKVLKSIGLPEIPQVIPQQLEAVQDDDKSEITQSNRINKLDDNSSSEVISDGKNNK